MDTKEAKDKINNLTDPKIQPLGNLLIDLGLELVACGNEDIIKKNGRDIAQVDLLFKDKNVKTMFLIETSKQQRDRGEKANYFFSRLEKQETKTLIYGKYGVPDTYKALRIYFDLSGKPDCPLDNIVISPEKQNYWLTSYDFEYFCDARDKIGRWARNDLYSFLGVIPPNKTTVEKDAIQFYLGDNVRAYAYVDTAKNLLEYCYIFRRKREDAGYQRMLDKGRIGDIARKIEHRNIFTFPNSILLSCPDGDQLCVNPLSRSDCPRTVKINIPSHFSACRVIDGQHRLLGFSKVDEIYQEQNFIPVVTIENIDQHKEMKTFIEINSGQKKIDRNLILVLQADFDWDPQQNPKEYVEKQAVQVVKNLNESNGSPLRKKVFIPEALAKKKGKITLNTLVSAILNNNFIGGKYHLYQHDTNDIDTPYQKLREVFILARKTFPEYASDIDGFLLTNKGLRILFRLLQVYERNVMANNVKMELKEFFEDLKNVIDDKVIEKLKDFYGEGGVNKAVQEIQRVLKKYNKVTYEDFESDLRKL
ncbi:MAG: DGQHR domain-containing protein [Sedimentisphaerales bacterium]|jgi:DGQHR domain-containing protein